MSIRSTASIQPNPVRVRFDRFELDEANATLLRDGGAIVLAPTPFALLCALVRQPAALLTKHALLDQVWGHQFVSDSVLKTAISDLRSVLEDDARHPRFIETVSRRGYRFIAATTALPTTSLTGADAADLGARQRSSFIGRTGELRRLRRAWEVAYHGKRTLVWVAGEPGIGKTTLIEHFMAGLGAVVCARGQCVEQYGMGEPYLPVLEALAELCRNDSAAAALLRTVAPTWLLQLPWLGTAEERDALRHELAGVGPERMLREMGELLDRYTEQRPLLLVTEDLHWSDRATIQLIEYIARRRGSGRLLWLASFRLTEVVAREHPLNRVRQELRLHRLCEEIVLDSFSEQEIADYVAEGSPSLARDEAFVRALHERTDGVPLFVTSVMNDVFGSVAPDGDATAQLAKMAVPENLTAIIEHYIAKLDQEQRGLLAAAAVCGVEFRVATIASALVRDAAWVGQTCEELAHEHLWLAASRTGPGSAGPEPPYAFRHALFRQVLYERTAPAARTSLHLKVGAVLERERAAGVPVTAGELAMHFERGRERLTALRYYAEAAEAALRHWSPDECLDLTGHALTLLDQTPKENERSTLEIALATLRGVAAAQRLGVGTSEAKDAFARAHARLSEVPHHPMRGLLLHAFGFMLCLRAEYAEALALAQQAERLATATNDPLPRLSACTVHGEVHMLQGRPRAARAWTERGLAAVAALAVPPEPSFLADPQVTLLGLLAIHLLHLGLVETARARLDEAHACACRLAQPMARMVALWFETLFEVRLGNAERVAKLADDMQALVDRFGLAQGRAAGRWFQGWAEARLGKPREGYRRIRWGYEENTRLGMVAGGSETLGYAAEALVLAGDWEAARHELAEALQIVTTHGERVYLPQLLLIEAAIARACGDSVAADASVRRAVAEARAQEASWLELVARVALCQGDGATTEDRHALTALLDQLPEAVETPLFRKAQALPA